MQRTFDKARRTLSNLKFNFELVTRSYKPRAEKEQPLRAPEKEQIEQGNHPQASARKEAAAAAYIQRPPHSRINEKERKREKVEESTHAETAKGYFGRKGKRTRVRARGSSRKLKSGGPWPLAAGAIEATRPRSRANTPAERQRERERTRKLCCCCAVR